MLLRVLLVTLQQQSQEYEREILNYIKNIARECMLGSPYVLTGVNCPKPRCRVLRVNNPLFGGRKE